MTTFSVAQSKGGSTKTTTAAELAYALAQRGRRVLAIDTDQQGNFGARLGLSEGMYVTAVTADVLVGDATALGAVVSPSVPGVCVLAGTHDLADLDRHPEVITALRDHLPEVAHAYDDVVIDTPPALGLVTLSALAAADIVVASVACETEAFDQLDRLRDVIAQRVARRLNPRARIDWVIPTRHDGRRLLDREIVELLTEQWGAAVTPPVREAVAARDAYSAGLPVSAYAPTSGIAADYATVMDRILGPAPQACDTLVNASDKNDKDGVR